MGVLKGETADADAERGRTSRLPWNMACSGNRCAAEADEDGEAAPATSMSSLDTAGHVALFKSFPADAGLCILGGVRECFVEGLLAREAVDT